MYEGKGERGRGMDITEKNVEETIERALLAGGPDAVVAEGAAHEPRLSYGEPATGGYHKRASAQYDPALCLAPDDVLAFIYASQPKEWDKFKSQQGSDARPRLLQRLAQEVRARGTLDVLRKGVKANGCKFQLVYFRPSSGLNAELRTLYEANVFSVVRQLHYRLDKDGKRGPESLDMVLFLNGLPLFTVELKNGLNGQTVQDAIAQYRATRDPNEPLFAFGRCLAHFAVDTDLVYMTTHLQGPKTSFLPFNQGRDDGAGNPPSWRGFATAYLWEGVWSRDSVLDLAQNFVQIVEEEDDEGRKTGARRLIFPRYHQLDAVRRLVAEARTVGAGQRYLVQHSAGSGKSNTISWLAHQLSALHDDADERVFDSIIVITDRRVLDRQLQRAVRQFEQTLGVVENIDTTSRQLKQALEDGKTIIVTTLQKFPVIVDQMGALPGRRFAVIIDEAHSSQSGASTTSLKKVLAAGDGGEDHDEEEDAGDLEDRIAAEAQARGALPNASFFAFTATPKAKTLEIFGTRRGERYEPFSLYSMRQAIEEGFILDVLENYVTYTTYWNLLKKVEDDPHYDRAKAAALLTSFVNLHEDTIAKKVAIMVDHFADTVARRIDGTAKAMIVTRSRLQAVRYKKEVDRYVQEKGYPYKALVAFSSPAVADGGMDYTESNMNHIPETQTAEAFKRDEYRFLIVANKYQTGFDQPRLHTMYVDKKLGGVNAVQTLSRLNRICPGKAETMVLDFANEAAEIQAAFAQYYQRTLLSEATDPNLLYDIQTRLDGFNVYGTDDIDRFAAVYYDRAATQDRLHALLRPVIARYEEAREDERVDFRGQLTDYLRLYAFLSQVVPFVDTDLEKLFVFGRLLLRKLPISRDKLPVEIQENISIDSYVVQRTGNGKITLPRGTTEVTPIGPKEGYVPLPQDLEPLSRIIRTLNEHYGANFTDEDKLCIRELEERLAGNRALEAALRANTRDNVRLTFDHVVSDLLQDMVDGHFRFYKRVTDDPAFAQGFNSLLFDRYVESAERIGDIVAQAPPDDPVGMAMDRAAHVLAQAGLTVGDLLDELPQIRDRVAREAYGDTFMDELGREYAALHKQESGAGD
jgi:type I restriction enzyme R subunit